MPFVLLGYPALNAAMYRLLGGSPVGLSLARFVAAALLLLVPTTLMGATLPLLSRHFVRDDGTSDLAGTVGRLYTINTFGAVVGTFLGGFVLLPDVGVRATNYTAAAINLSLAAAVLIGRRSGWRRRATTSWRRSGSTRRRRRRRPSSSHAGCSGSVALVAFAVSGAIAMVDQVLWTRALAIIIGSSVYSFTLILLAFLVGLAGGAAIFSRLTARTTRRPMEWLAGVHLATAAMIGVLVPGHGQAAGGVLGAAPRRRLLRRRHHLLAVPAWRRWRSSPRPCAWAASCRLTMRVVAARSSRSAATSAPPTRSTRSAPSSARSPPASSSCPWRACSAGSASAPW